METTGNKDSRELMATPGGLMATPGGRMDEMLTALHSIRPAAPAENDMNIPTDIKQSHDQDSVGDDHAAMSHDISQERQQKSAANPTMTTTPMAVVEGN